MAREKLAALLAAAGTGIVIGFSAAGYAADDVQQGQGAGLPTAGQTSERSQSPNSQAIGGTSGTASTGALQANPDRSMQDSRSPYESTYVTPYELRTPGPRDNIDD